ncbi:MAG: HAMP domain-containing sensor histidine kinase, partial [Elusimicrobiota bacterium]
RRAEEEKTRLLVESVRRVLEESLLAGDPLMVLDHLAFLKKDKPEVLHCRIFLGGKWQEVGGGPAPAPGAGATKHPVSVVTDSRIEGKAELWLSDAVLEERRREASAAMLRNAARAGAFVVLLALAASALLAHTLTRRIVLIERALTAIGEGRLGERASAEGSDEIARLARGVNEMSGRLAELEEMKKTFIASVTHELRSPLGAIESQVRETLGSEELTPGGRESLERIRKNAARLEHFVASLLELSKIERGRLDFSPKRADLGALIEDSALFFSPRAKEAGLDIETRVEPGLAPMDLDAALLSQVLANLLSNAIKFTRPGGRILLSARKSGAGVEVSVQDDGVGMPSEALGRIFRPFERVRNPLRASGAGLGLAISKSIVEMHGGGIGVSSEEGKGSRFFFSLPDQRKT